MIFHISAMLFRARGLNGVRRAVFFRTCHRSETQGVSESSTTTLGEGRFILNSLNIRQQLGHLPAAERLLRNMLNYAGRDMAMKPAALPADFDSQLGFLGYK